jgi:peptide/nickel transport system substrate-binding protein
MLRTAVVILAISAVVPMQTAAAAPAGEIVIAGAILRHQFDPTIMVAMPDYSAYDLLYDGLLNLGPKGKYPALATGWKVSDDGKVIDFELRKGVKFHNGDPFTAEDVKFTYETMLKPGNTHSYRKAFVESIERIEAVEPHKVRFVLKQPWPSFFSSSRYGLQPIVPKNYYEKLGARGFSEKPVGTGPYRLVGTKAGEFSRFEANAEYWGQVSRVKFVTQRMVKEPFTLYAMLEKGEADIVFGLSGPLMDRVRTNPKVRIFQSRYSGTSGIYFSKSKFPESSDRRVRMAVAHAINRDEIAKRMLGGVCEPATSIFTPATFGFLPGLKPIPYDPAKAKALFAESGVKPGREVTYTLHTESFGSLPSAPQVLEAIAGNLEAVGFKVQREQVDTSTWLAMMRGKKQPSVFYGPSSMPDDGGETIEGWYSSSSVWSSGNISVPEYDQVFKAQLQLVDPKKREAILQDFARLEDERREAVPLFWCHTAFAAGPRIRQWTPGVSSAYHYNFQSIELGN